MKVVPYIFEPDELEESCCGLGDLFDVGEQEVLKKKKKCCKRYKKKGKSNCKNCPKL